MWLRVLKKLLCELLLAARLAIRGTSTLTWSFNAHLESFECSAGFSIDAECVGRVVKFVEVFPRKIFVSRFSFVISGLEQCRYHISRHTRGMDFV